MDKENAKVFRKSINGYNRDDVNSYISEFNVRCQEQIERTEKLCEEERKAKQLADSALAETRADLDRLTDELGVLKSENERLNGVVGGAVSRIAEAEAKLTDKENSLSSYIEAGLEKDREIASLKNEIAELKRTNASLSESAFDNRPADEIAEARERAESIIAEAEEKAAKIAEEAKVNADVVASRAERESAIIKLRAKNQRKELSALIDSELNSLMSTIANDCAENVNSALVGLSELYNKLYGESNDYDEKMVRERSDTVTALREKLLRSIERTAGISSDSDYDSYEA